jgi:tRNA threonylcarbamoyladenosine biosynthesis protein TsaB
VILLALDTATPSCSVALVEDERVRGELRRRDGETHSRHLMTMVDAVLKKGGVGPSDIDALAVTRGPGSFTGIRIGMATAKGLSAALGIPLMGVSSLDALALQAPESAGLRCCLVDARKQQVYCGFYRPDGQGVIRQVREPFAAGPEQVAGGIGEPCLFIGDGALLYRDRLLKRLGSLARFAPEADHQIRAATVGRIGFRRRACLGDEAGRNLVPLYIRKSDAELSLGSA